jgi:P2 family phage contractile tail tube protein
MEQLTVNYDVYEDNTRFDGTASATLPDISFLVQSLSGAGVGGNIEAVTPHLDAMTLTLNFRETTDEAFNLARPERHMITLRASRQDEDPVSNSIKQVSIKHVLVVIPKGLTGGQLQPHNATNPSGTYAVRYFATFINGKKETEIDPMNYICYIHGKDYLADVKNALGR